MTGSDFEQSFKFSRNTTVDILARTSLSIVSISCICIGMIGSILSTLL